MTSNPSFNYKTKAEEVSSTFKDRIKGKHFVITGGNIGLGKETARVLAKEGGIVTICCRTLSKGEEAKSDILREFPEAQVSVMLLDLASLKAIKAFAEAYTSTGKPLNVLINNAGIMACPKSKTADGFESQFGTNHLGHFYLTSLLVPLLHSSGSTTEPSRVVNLSSAANILWTSPQGISFDDLDAEKSYNQWERYGQSKLANILFSAELNKLMKSEGKNVVSVSLHPGVISSTNLNSNISLFGLFNMFWSTNRSAWGKMSDMKSMKSIPEGTATTIVCALDPKIEFGLTVQRFAPACHGCSCCRKALQGL